MAAEEELEGLAGAEFGGEVGGGAQQRHGGGADAGGGRAGDGVDRAEPGGEHLVEYGGQSGREVLVGAGGQLQPVGGPVAYDEQGAAGVDEGGDGAGGVAAEVLPDAFAERDLGELALGAQPLFDLGEGERGAGLGASDGLGEVGVPAAPVADGGAADAREPRDVGRGDLGCGPVGGVVRHWRHWLAPLVGRYPVDVPPSIPVHTQETASRRESRESL